jgi:hypothetical protein
MAVVLIGITMAMVACATTGVVRAKRTRALDSMTDDQCVALLDKRDDARLAAKILAGVGGLGALGTAPVDSEAGRWAIGASAATLVAVGGVVLWYGEQKAKAFETYCEVGADEAAARVELMVVGPTDAGVADPAVAELAPNPFGGDGGTP